MAGYSEVAPGKTKNLDKNIITQPHLVVCFFVSSFLWGPRKPFFTHFIGFIVNKPLLGTFSDSPKGFLLCHRCFQFLFAIDSVLMETFRFVHPFLSVYKGGICLQKTYISYEIRGVESNAIRHLLISHNTSCLPLKILHDLLFLISPGNYSRPKRIANKAYAPNGSLYVAGKLPTYPSPKPTITLLT